MGRKQWDKQERRLAREGARRIGGSGCGFRKGDNIGDNFLVQAKSTVNDFVTLKEDDLVKSVKEARREERIAVMQYEIGGPDHLFALLLQKDYDALAEEGEYEGHFYSPSLHGKKQIKMHRPHGLMPDESIDIHFATVSAVLMTWNGFTFLIDSADLAL